MVAGYVIHLLNTIKRKNIYYGKAKIIWARHFTCQSTHRLISLAALGFFSFLVSPPNVRHHKQLYKQLILGRRINKLHDDTKNGCQGERSPWFKYINKRLDPQNVTCIHYVHYQKYLCATFIRKLPSSQCPFWWGQL